MADVKISQLTRVTPITDGMRIPCSVKVGDTFKSRMIQTDDFVEFTYRGILAYVSGGRGIGVNWDENVNKYVVSCDLDTSVAKVVTELPESGVEKDKLYLVLNTSNTSEGNIYTEYIYVNKGTSETPDWTWEKLGERSIDTDFSNYFTKSDVYDVVTTYETNIKTYVADNYATSTSYNALNSTVSDIVSAYVSKDYLTAQSYANTTQVDAKYTKPTDGIPASDLAQAVQDSLELADSAIQNVDDKQDKITSSAMLSSDLVDDTDNTHKFVTSNQITAWNGKTTMGEVEAKNYLVASDIAGKQDTIDATHKLSADLVDDSSASNKFVTASEKSTWNAKQDAITSDNKLSADLLSEGSTYKLVTEAEKNEWNAKLSATSIADLGYITGEAAANSYATITSVNAITEPTTGTIDTRITAATKLSSDYAASDATNDALNPAGGDTFQTAISKLHKAILDNESTTATSVSTIKTSLGFGEGLNYSPSASALSGKNVTEAVDYLAGQVASQSGTLDGKQDTISDLETIRSNASNGQAAYAALNPTGEGAVTYDQLKAEVVALRAIVNAMAERLGYGVTDGEVTWSKEFLELDI